MRICRYLLFALAFITSGSHAQDESDVQAFNDAWLGYQAAMQAKDIDLQIATSRDVLAAGEVIFEESDERVPLLMVNYGNALIDGKQREKGQKVILQALEIAETIHGKDSTKLVPILGRLANAYDDLDGNRRLRYYGKALKIVEKDSGKNSDAYAALAVKAGASLYRTARGDAGERYIESAHGYLLAEFGESHIDTGIAAFYLGKYAFSERKYQSTTNHLTKALIAFQGDTQESIQFQLLSHAMLVKALEFSGESDAATEHCVAIGRLSEKREDQDYLPLFRLAPRYPSTMLSRRAEGFVDLSYTIDKSGFIRNAEVIDTGPGDGGFKQAAIDAVEKFRYAPRFEDGAAVSVDNVKTRITFSLER